jgi:hypothetical protein
MPKAAVLAGLQKGVTHPMTAPAELHVPTESRARDFAAFLRQGALAGLFGAALLAGWFLYLDVLRGKPLFTPTVLARAVLGAGGIGAPATLEGSLWLTLLFTLLHGLVFAGIGVGAAYLLYHFAVVRNRALIIVLLFTVLCLGFFAFAVNVAAVGPQAVAVRDALVGNAIAAFAMGAYLARHLPRVEHR